MDNIKTDTIVYLEFSLNGDIDNYPRRGVYKILEQDRWNILTKDQEMLLLIPKKYITICESDSAKWPKSIR